MPGPASVINRALLALWALFWALMILVALEDWAYDEGIHVWEPLLWEGSSCIVATAWLLLQRHAAHRWDALLGTPARWFARHLAWMPVVVVTFIPAIYLIRHGVYALVGDTYEHEPYASIFVYEALKILLFSVLWLCIIFGLESFSSWRRERERLLTLQKHLAESQLGQLRAQLQPHFLFNALNTISSLMQVDVDRADRLLTRLADLLRASLQSSTRQMSALREEKELLELYAAIMLERFAGRVTLSWSFAPDTLDAEVPAMLLQPLLENAFKHGVERSSTPVSISIDARRDGDLLRVEIRNTPAPVAEFSRAGIGLANSRERLALLYGAAATLSVGADKGGVSARLSLPYRPANTTGAA